MKFFSYTNKNENYYKAISLENVRSVQRINGEGKSAIRFSVRLEYIDGKLESLPYLENSEATQVFNKIVNLLNK